MFDEDAFNRLTVLQQRFVLAYTRMMLTSSSVIAVAGRAAKEAGYGGVETTLAVTASVLLHKNKDVRACIESWRRTEIMQASEIEQRLSGIARANMEEVIETVRDAEGKPLESRIVPGMGWLVKAVEEWTDKTGRLHRKFVLHDAPDALKTMAKIQGRLVDVLALKKLPEDPAELQEVLKKEIERTTGRKVVSVSDDKKDAN